MKQEIKEQITKFIHDSFLKQFLINENITDISFNGTDLRVQDNFKGRYKSEYQPTKDEVFQLGKRIADIQGKEFTNSSPILDTELDYLRVNFVHDAISPSGTTFAIRVSRPILAMTDISEVANKDVEKLLELLIKAETNMVIAGKTGSGKTELQKLLVGYIPDDQKITLIEDTMDSHIKELYPNKDINSWRTLTEETRENKIDYIDLNKAALRNNPDWIIIAETRSSEAYSVVDSALTDHNIITTLHCKGAAAIISRFLRMIGRKYQINELLYGQDIVTAFPIGIYMEMIETEKGIVRRIKEIVEFTDFTEKGANYITLYRLNKSFNETNGEYVNEVITNSLSNKTLEELKYKGLYHLVPNTFKTNRRGKNE